MTETPTSKGKDWRWDALNNTGWVVFVLSAWFFLRIKSENNSLGPVCFFGSLGVLVLGSAVYCVGACYSKSWRSRAMRSAFSPYLLGVVGWSVLILFLIRLYQLRD